MPKCEQLGCGREMDLRRAPCGSDEAWFECPATPDQHEIAALKKELEKAEQTIRIQEHDLLVWDGNYTKLQAEVGRLKAELEEARKELDRRHERLEATHQEAMRLGGMLGELQSKEGVATPRPAGRPRKGSSRIPTECRSLRLTVDTWAELQRLAEHEGRSMNWLIEESVLIRLEAIPDKAILTPLDELLAGYEETIKQRDAAQALASERGAQVLALRKLGRHLDFVIDNTPPHKSRTVEIRAAQMAWREALTSTADAAAHIEQELASKNQKQLNHPEESL